MQLLCARMRTMEIKNREGKVIHKSDDYLSPVRNLGQRM